MRIDLLDICNCFLDLLQLVLLSEFNVGRSNALNCSVWNHFGYLLILRYLSGVGKVAKVDLLEPEDDNPRTS